MEGFRTEYVIQEESGRRSVKIRVCSIDMKEKEAKKIIEGFSKEGYKPRIERIGEMGCVTVDILEKFKI